MPARRVDDSDCLGWGGHGAFGRAVVVGGGQLHRVVVCREVGVGSTRSVFEFSRRWGLERFRRARSDSEGRPRGCGGHSFLVLRWLLCLFSSGVLVILPFPWVETEANQAPWISDDWAETPCLVFYSSQVKFPDWAASLRGSATSHQRPEMRR